VQSAELLFSGVGRDPDWGRFQDDGRRERKRDLEFVPAPELNSALHGNVKAQDGGSRLVRKQHRTLFRDVTWAARTINGKRGVFSSLNIPTELRQRTQAASRARAPRHAISKSLDALCDRFAVQIHTGHDDNAAIPPVIGCGEDSAVPEREDRAPA